MKTTISGCTVTATLFITIILLMPCLVSASHFRLENDFDFGSTNSYLGINGIISDGSPFGGKYVKAITSNSLTVGVIDALPAGTTEDPSGYSTEGRYLLLSFDVINFTPSSEIFNILFDQDGAVTQHELSVANVTAGEGANFSFEMNLVLQSSTVDFAIDFKKMSPNEWGMDNIIIDWGTPVPIPAAGWFFISAISGFISLAKISHHRSKH